MTPEPVPYHVRVTGCWAPGSKLGPTEHALVILAEGIDELLHRRRPEEKTATPEILAVWEAYVRVFNRPRAQLTLKRRRVIASRLKDGFTLERMTRAFEGCKASDFHMRRGRYANRDGQLFCDLELILRDGGMVERFESMPLQQETDPVLVALRYAESVPHMQVHRAVATALAQESDPGGIHKEKAYRLLMEAGHNVAEAIRLRQREVA